MTEVRRCSMGYEFSKGECKEGLGNAKVFVVVDIKEAADESPVVGVAGVAAEEEANALAAMRSNED